MADLGRRIEERLKAVGFSQAELARRVGVSQPAINHLIKKGAGGSAHLHKIARELDTTPEYLSGETDSPDRFEGVGDRQSEFRGAPVESADTVKVGQLIMRYGMGETVLEDYVEVEQFSFSRAWLRYYTDVSPEHLRWVRGIGDSMEPTIRDGDPLLVHLGAPMDAHDLVWVCAYGEMGMIKRLRPLPDGSIEVLSDNPHVPSFKAYDGELHLIARVLGKMGRL